MIVTYDNLINVSLSIVTLPCLNIYRKLDLNIAASNELAKSKSALSAAGESARKAGFNKAIKQEVWEL